ncbi:g12285 [Coccomyxa viridis]|uniref:G12285 protein n=1 Tax=Coccomyxa viridis TaxID=1274662 RepID=A0ABP1GCN0_9CHLO
MTDAEIMEVAQKDLIVIQDVLAGKRPPEHLRDATHLIKAYHEYLSKIRKLGMIRPWETSSLSQAYVKALAKFCQSVHSYSSIPDPAKKKGYRLSYYADTGIGHLYNACEPSIEEQRYFEVPGV